MASQNRGMQPLLTLFEIHCNLGGGGVPLKTCRSCFQPLWSIQDRFPVRKGEITGFFCCGKTLGPFFEDWHQMPCQLVNCCKCVTLCELCGCLGRKTSVFLILSLLSPCLLFFLWALCLYPVCPWVPVLNNLFGDWAGQFDPIFKSFGLSCLWNLGTGNGRMFVLELLQGDCLEQPLKLLWRCRCSAMLLAERGMLPCNAFSWACWHYACQGCFLWPFSARSWMHGSWCKEWAWALWLNGSCIHINGAEC